MRTFGSGKYKLFLDEYKKSEICFQFFRRFGLIKISGYLKKNIKISLFLGDCKIVLLGGLGSSNTHYSSSVVTLANYSLKVFCDFLATQQTNTCSK